MDSEFLCPVCKMTEGQTGSLRTVMIHGSCWSHITHGGRIAPLPQPPMSESVLAAQRAIMVHGPDRMYVWRNGGWEGVRPRVLQSAPDEGPRPVVVLIRYDGWSLGAASALAAREAYQTYRKEWSAFMEYPHFDLKPMDLWRYR